MYKKFEGFSNHANILKEITDKVEKSWDRIVNNGYKGSVTYKFKPNMYDILDKPDMEDIKDKNGNLKMVTVKVAFGVNDNIIDKGTYVKKTKWNRWYIKVNTAYYEMSPDTFQIKSKDKIFANLVHEIVHISQHYNGFSIFVEDEFSKKFLKKKRKISYNTFYTNKHSEYPTEKESVLVEFFEYLKRDKLNAFNYLMSVPQYFNYYSYRKFINKAVKYGVDIKDIYYIKDELKKYLDDKVAEIMKNKAFTNNVFQELEPRIPLYQQFNINYKDKLEEIQKMLEDTPRKRILQHNQLKNKIDNLLK